MHPDQEHGRGVQVDGAGVGLRGQPNQERGGRTMNDGNHEVLIEDNSSISEDEKQQLIKMRKALEHEMEEMQKIYQEFSGHAVSLLFSSFFLDVTC